MMTHHFAMTSSLLIKILKIDKFGVLSRDIGFKTKMDIFRDDISHIINQCHLQATEGSLRRTRSVRQPRSASKREARLYIYIYSRVRLLASWVLHEKNLLISELNCIYIYIQARFACLRYTTGRHFVSTRGVLWTLRLTLMKYKLKITSQITSVLLV